MIDHKEKTTARRSLVASAREAKMNGIPREEWEHSVAVQDYIEKKGLRSDIAKHISVFVWTFRR